MQKNSHCEIGFLYSFRIVCLWILFRYIVDLVRYIRVTNLGKLFCINSHFGYFSCCCPQVSDSVLVSVNPSSFGYLNLQR